MPFNDFHIEHQHDVNTFRIHHLTNMDQLISPSQKQKAEDHLVG